MNNFRIICSFRNNFRIMCSFRNNFRIICSFMNIFLVFFKICKSIKLLWLLVVRLEKGVLMAAKSREESRSLLHTSQQLFSMYNRRSKRKLTSHINNACVDPGINFQVILLPASSSLKSFVYSLRWLRTIMSRLELMQTDINCS